MVTSTPNLNIHKYSNYTYVSALTGSAGVQIGYTTSLNNVDYFRATVFVFRNWETQIGCEENTDGEGNYIYDVLYESLPSSCQDISIGCHDSCVSCIDVD